MIFRVPADKGPLWAALDRDDDGALPFWKALLIAFAIEFMVPVLVFGVNWHFPLPDLENEPVEEMMVVELLEIPPESVLELPEEIAEELVELKPPPPEKPIEQIDIEIPLPLPDEVPAEIQIAQKEPEPEPEPEPEVEPEEEEPEPEPEPEAPALPSVFLDVKPVKKIKPKYPREAEDKHIEGSVKVRLTVSPAGTVTDVELLAAEPPGVFEEAVLAAVWQYQFKKDGTTFKADQEIIFRLE
ncbi:MAG TPA: energy transducer TonB [Burkholderiales bacterium]|nr:energy transducer TonB [Burkholderiales bacterium]